MTIDELIRGLRAQSTGCDCGECRKRLGYRVLAADRLAELQQKAELERLPAVLALRRFADEFQNDLDSEFLGADVRRHALALADRIERGES